MKARLHPWARIGGEPEHREWSEGDTSYPPEVHPTVKVSAFCTVDSGTERATKIGARSALFQHVHLGHDVVVGERTEIATSTVVGGHATIGSDVRIGINATILPYRNVGDGARVGAGAVVVDDVEPGTVVAGNPARYIRDVTDEERSVKLGTDGKPA